MKKGALFFTDHRNHHEFTFGVRLDTIFFAFLPHPSQNSSSAPALVSFPRVESRASASLEKL